MTIPTREMERTLLYNILAVFQRISPKEKVGFSIRRRGQNIVEASTQLEVGDTLQGSVMKINCWLKEKGQ